MAAMMRREFIAAGAAIGLPLQAAAMQQSAPRYTGNPQLKITDVQVFIVNAGSSPDGVGFGGKKVCYRLDKEMIG